MLGIALLCLLLTSWKEQNQRIFKWEQCIIQALKDSLITNMLLWSRGFLLGDEQEGQLVCYLL